MEHGGQIRSSGDGQAAQKAGEVFAEGRRLSITRESTEDHSESREDTSEDRQSAIGG